MTTTWTPPQFQRLDCNSECTAYSGTLDGTDDGELVVDRLSQVSVATDTRRAGLAIVTGSVAEAERCA